MFSSPLSVSLIGAVLALASTLGKVAPERLSVKDASEALRSDAHCIQFRWATSPQGERGGIVLPAVVNGMPGDFQLDTGSDASIIYGDTADRNGWSAMADKRFSPKAFVAAGADLSGHFMYVFRDMHAGELRGTLGMADLAGRVVIIDYPGRRFCLFKPADAPPNVMTSTQFANATLRNGKLFLPVTLGATESGDILFDTGSSEIPLNVDLPLWKILTGIEDPRTAPIKLRGSAWGKPVVLDGAQATGGLARIGSIPVRLGGIYTQEGASDRLAREPFKVSGVIGNAPFWDGIVVLDLTPYARFGVLQ